jgi:hypothetical protein
MNGILVSVDYADLLSITLPWNRRHFDRMVVVTTPGSEDGDVARKHEAEVFETNEFYANGATFNKWLCLEQGLNWMGRTGWICLMDADVLWPRRLVVGQYSNSENLSMWSRNGGDIASEVRPGQICSPLRRMWENWPGNWLPLENVVSDSHFQDDMPPEDLWNRFPIHRNIAEWAGYSQIFHASDPVLGSVPWHEIDWRHAGGADSFFQRKWPANKKIRPSWECLHLGPAGQNWMGRRSMWVDGSVPVDAVKKEEMIAKLWKTRAQRRKQGLDQFATEKLGKLPS